MPTNGSRKFTSIDALVLTTATALAFVPIWLFYNDPDTYLGQQEDGSMLWSIWLLGWELNILFSALIVAWSAALFVLRLKRPRPNCSRIYRQPGAAACLAIVVATFYFVTQYGVLVCFYHAGGYAWNHAAMLIGWENIMAALAGWVDISVPVVWLVLWLGGICRPEPTWIDRTGRTIGVYCTVSSILFGWAELVSKG
jgi:hypothetical protein